MTTALSGLDIARQIKTKFPNAVAEASVHYIIINNDDLLRVAQYLKETSGLDFDYLNSITGVDYFDYFEIIYYLVSMKHNHSLVIKTRCYGREKPSAPSVVSLWRSADYQEREIYDLLGVTFTGHPNMKRIVMWDGFQGHPLRRDYV